MLLLTDETSPAITVSAPIIEIKIYLKRNIKKKVGRGSKKKLRAQEVSRAFFDVSRFLFMEAR